MAQLQALSELATGIGVLGLLFVAVVLLSRGVYVTGANCEAEVAALREGYEKLLVEVREQLARERERHGPLSGDDD
jgi:hypothetical protein